MQYALIAMFVGYSLMILGIGFFCGRAERSSARLTRIYQQTDFGGRYL